MSEIEAKEGLRARKRRETLQRIAEAGLRLFVDKGYDATTLEEVAVEAGISPRTLFHYFGAKDEILHYWNGGGAFLDALAPAIVAEGSAHAPLVTVREALLRLIPQFETAQSVTVLRLFNSTDALRARKQSAYVHIESILHGALTTLWPDPARALELRAVAMLASGALRLAGEIQQQEAQPERLHHYVARVFATVESRVLAG